MTTPPISKQQERFTGDNQSGMNLYRELTVGGRGWGYLIWYEFVTGLGSLLPGILGYGFRTFFYPTLLKASGARPLFGAKVVVKNPGDISLGNKVLIDDGASLDCRLGSVITLDDFVSVGKGTILAAKGGDIKLASGVNVGSQCRIATQSGITVGESTLIAAYCYIGPGNHQRDEDSGTYIAGEMELKGGVKIGKNVWIGTRATILDGVTIGDGAVIGAHSLVRESVPAGATVAGCPAKVVA